MAPNERSEQDQEDQLGCSKQILTGGKSRLVFFVNGNFFSSQLEVVLFAGPALLRRQQMLGNQMTS